MTVRWHRVSSTLPMKLLLCNVHLCPTKKKQKAVCPSCVRTAPLSHSPPPTLTFPIVAFLNCVSEASSRGGRGGVSKQENAKRMEVIFHINVHNKMRS